MIGIGKYCCNHSRVEAHTLILYHTWLFSYAAYISVGMSCFSKAEVNTAEHSANVVCDGMQRARLKRAAFPYK